jgi:hypothetical protein
MGGDGSGTGADSESSVTRSRLINEAKQKTAVPSGLKPLSLLALCGTAEAVPYPKPIYWTACSEEEC